MWFADRGGVMKEKWRGPSPDERGFSMIEMLIVVALIAILVGVALPSIATYVRNFRMNGAEREVASELASARSRAISKNSQAGVSFMIVDADSYRFIVEDGATTLGPLHDLPTGVIFLPPGNAFPPGAGGLGFAIRFNRLGAACPTWGATNCVLAAPGNPIPTCAPDPTRCANGPTPGSNYLDLDANGAVRLGLFEVNTGLRKLIRIEPGGRIQTVSQ
jgi:prepilin-type N-terminal cleavage/methylation domain-containing protein